MVNQEWCHAKTGRVANTDAAADIGIKLDCLCWRGYRSHMLDNINGK